MSNKQLTRRAVMRNGSAAVGAATLASVAGCLSSVPFVGGGASYKKWLPEPGTLESGADHYNFTYLDMKAIEKHEDEFSSDTSGSIKDLEDLWSPARFDWDDTSDIIFLQGSYVVMADFDRDSVEDDLKDENYDDDTDHEGYTIFVNSEGSRGLAVGDGTVVVTRAYDGDPVSRAESLIDTSKGNEDRYVDDSEDMKELVDALGTGTIVRGGTMEEPSNPKPEEGQFKDQLGRGRNLTVNGANSDVTHVVLYESKNDVDTGDLEDWVESNDGTDEQFEHLEDPSYKQNGRKGIIKGKQDTDEI